MGVYPTFTVSEITRLIRSTLETQFSSVRVEGEVSNLTYHRSGHIYFSLKDEYALLNCVIWRGNRSSLRFRIEEGMYLIARGEITVFEKGGRYQLSVQEVSPAGIGPLLLKFQAIKKELEKKGYFAAERKRPLPPFPKKIGIVTSPTGAAIRDIIKIAKRRNPHINLLLYPALVQGEGAPSSIAEGIRSLNERKDLDVLIVGRGGGSIEDLWAFNEPEVAEAIYNSKIPVVSAVGHETDFTISDFVADLRAPTPSAAAELTVPGLSELVTTLDEQKVRIANSLDKIIRNQRGRLQYLATRPCFQKPEAMFRSHWQFLDYITLQIKGMINSRLSELSSKLNSFSSTLKASSPLELLKKGYAIVQEQESGRIITDVENLRPDSLTLTKVSKGEFRSRVTEIINSENKNVP